MPTPRADRTFVGSAPGAGRHNPETKPYTRSEASSVPEFLIATAARVGVVTGLREAAERNDAEHIAGIATGGLAYVQAWLRQVADDIENREYEKQADGGHIYGRGKEC